MGKEIPSMSEFEYIIQRRTYLTSRKLFHDYYKKAMGYKDNSALTNSQFSELTETIRLGMMTLEYQTKLRSIRAGDKLMRERAVLRRRIDRLREIMYDPNKEIVPDPDLEGRVD